MNRKNVEDLYPLTPLQQGMLFHSLYAPESGAYAEHISMTLRGDVRPAELERAWAMVVERHPVLRTGFVWEGVPQPLQVVFRQAAPDFVFQDWSDLPASEAARRFAETMDEDKRRGWELGQAPLLRLFLARVAPDEHRLLVSFHHLLLDGWSLPRVFGEVRALYAGMLAGSVPRLPRPRPFHDYVTWLGKQDAGAAEAYWRRRLDGFEEATPVPLDLDPARAGTPAESFGQETAQLPPGFNIAVNDAARRHRVTPNTLVQAAWALLLARYCGTDDVVFGAVVSGRPPELAGVEDMVGMFINTVPVRVKIPDSMPVGDWLRAQHAQDAGARQYEHAPLVQVRGWSGVGHDRPLFETLLAFENYQSGGHTTADLQPPTTPASPPPPRRPAGGAPSFAAAAAASGAAGAAPPESAGEGVYEMAEMRGAERTNYPLGAAVAPGGLGLRVNVNYDPSRLDAPRARALLYGFVALLHDLVGDGTRPVGALTPMGPGERRHVVEAWNPAPADYPRDVPLHRLFEARARETPDAVAVEWGTERLTYAALNARANRMARRLRALGVGPESRVGIATERSPGMVAAMLAALKAGGAYVPLDPSHPADRLAFMRADAGLAAVVVDRRGAGDAGGVPDVCLACDGALLDALPADDLDDDGADGESLAYVIYTSGSTGTPKGVGVPHRAAARLALAGDFFPVAAGDRVAQVTNASFDPAVLEVWGALLNGATLVGFDRETVLSPAAMAEAVRERGITAMVLTTAVLHHVARELPDAFAPVEHLVFGGEAADPAALRRVLAAGPPRRLLNAYGPTESAVVATWQQVTEVPPGAPLVPIGRALTNTAAYVVGPDLRPVPVGAPGELCLGGDGLARGYLGRPALTAERFVPSPFRAGGRLYRTGDRVRWNHHGEIEFLGRLDRQVKVRGYRVEPGEVEAALAALPDVAQAVVEVGDDGHGGRRLVAYAVPREGAAATPAAIRDALAAVLPAYMVPAVVMVLPALPLTPNGKVDRRALPAPEAAADEDAYVPPKGAVQEALARVWSEVLRVERVGANDSFFELGGHSLMATQVVTRVREGLGVDLPLRAVFEAPRLAELAARVEEMQRSGTYVDVPLVAVRGDQPLSFAQERLWFLHRLEPGSPLYNIPSRVRMRGSLDVDALRRALSEVVRRHEALRTVFAEVDGRPVQRVLPAGEVPLPVHDLSAMVTGAKGAEARRLAEEDAAAPFDLAAGPLFRASVLRMGEGDHILLLAFHHAVADGWSMGIFHRELSALYDAFTHGRPSPLPELPVQYAAFAAWQRRWLTESRVAEQLAYWKTQLAGAPPLLELPSDFPRPAVQRHRGGTATTVLRRTLLDDVYALAAAHDATPAMVLLAAFQLLLGRLAGQDDVVVGAPIAGRTRPETERMIGMFLNTLALRTRLGGNPTFAGLLARVRETMLGAYANQDIPFERLIEELQPARSLAHSPIFQVMFNLVNVEGASHTPASPSPDASSSPEASSSPAAEETGDAGDGEAGIRFTGLGAADDQGSKVDLTLYLKEGERGLQLNAVYDADLFTEARVREILRQFGRVLRQVTREPQTPIARVSLLSEKWTEILPDPEAPLDSTWRGSVGELFARRAAEAPGALAAEDPPERWTYGELHADTDAIARRLVEAGLRAGDVVAIHGHRSAALVRALLATLKSGAAFLVLDPSYPPARLAEYVRIAAPKAFLRITAAGDLPRELDAVLRSTSLVTIELHARDGDESHKVDKVAIGELSSVEIGPDSLAYLSFTSGTTGAPKAVMGRQGSLTHFTPWTAEEFGLTAADRFSLLSGLAHDPLHRDVFTALQLGAAVVAPEPGEIGTPGYLARWMREKAITVAHLTPAMGQVLVDANDAAPVDSLRRAFFVGDVLTRTDVDRLHRLAPHVTVVNYYGSTETQRAVGYHVVARERREGEKEIVPLGRGIPGVQLVLRGRAGQLAGVGEVAEIWLRSPHVALGYLGDAELTRQRFFANPWTESAADPVYRTGDLGRYRPDGVVEPLGRADQQVQVRGFRVELGEVEAALASHPSVREAVVLARGAGAALRLVAYVTSTAGAVDGDALRAHLRALLPDFMVPSALVRLDALPLTANGKVDRAALPEPEREAGAAHVAPRTLTEEVIAGIVSEVLGLENVSVVDDFFALGGHSLRATQVLSRMQQALGVTLPLRAVFETPTVAGLAAAVEGAGGGEIARLLDELEDLSDEEIEALLAAEAAGAEEQ